MNTEPTLINLQESFPDSTFKYLARPPPGRSKCCGVWDYCGSCRACDVCGTTVKGPIYHCFDTGFDVHPRCARLETRIHVDGVEFELRKRGLSKCNWCKKKQLKGSVKNVPGFCYVSRCDNYSFHVYCLMDMGIEYGSASSAGKELAVPELRLRKKPSRDGGQSGLIRKLGKAVGLFLKIVLSVLFGDPTMILASVVVHLLKP